MINKKVAIQIYSSYMTMPVKKASVNINKIERNSEGVEESCLDDTSPVEIISKKMKLKKKFQTVEMTEGLLLRFWNSVMKGG